MAKKGLDSLVLRHSGALEDEGKSVSLGLGGAAQCRHLPQSASLQNPSKEELGQGTVRKCHIKHALCTSGHKSPHIALCSTTPEKREETTGLRCVTQF